MGKAQPSHFHKKKSAALEDNSQILFHLYFHDDLSVHIGMRISHFHLIASSALYLLNRQIVSSSTAIRGRLHSGSRHIGHRTFLILRLLSFFPTENYALI